MKSALKGPLSPFGVSQLKMSRLSVSLSSSNSDVTSSSPSKLSMLEEKRQRLAEVRARRLATEQNRVGQAITAHRQNAPENVRASYNPEEIDNLLRDIGVEFPRTNGTDNDIHTAVALTPKADTPKIVPSIILSFSEVLSTNISPKDKIHYQKSTQTDDDRCSVSEFNMGSQELDFDDDMMHVYRERITARTHSNELESPNEQDLASILPDFISQKLMQSELLDDGSRAAPKETESIVDLHLSDEEKKKIVSDPRFQKFVSQAGKVMLRAMCDPNSTNVDVDYSKPVDDGPKRILLGVQRKFDDAKLTHNRPVTGISFHTVHKELFAVSYGPKADDVEDCPGLIVVWNTKFKSDVPEFVFTSSSRLTSVVYARAQAHLLLAGCYSGQICVWDTRENKGVIRKTPVHKSPPFIHSHTQPVFSMVVRGTHNACNLFSASTDGRLCMWTVDNLQKPLTSKELLLKRRHAPTQPAVLPVLCIGMSYIDNNYICVGCEDGRVFRLNRHQPLTEEDIIQYSGHKGGVCCLQFNRFERCIQGMDFSNLFLTSSFDWTIKLWSLKENGCIYTFEDHADFVTAVAWSPTHPGIFASIDAQGWLLVHNLAAKNGETCVAHARVSDSIAQVKLSFSETGDSILVGDFKGTITVYHMIPELVTPKVDDLQQMEQNLKEWRRLYEDGVEIQRLKALADEYRGVKSTAQVLSSIMAQANLKR